MSAHELFSASFAPKPPSTNSYARSAPRNPKSARSSATSTRESSYSHEDDIEYYKERALNGEDFSRCPVKVLPTLVGVLKDERDSLISSGRFDDSEVADSAYRQAKTLAKNRTKARALKDYKNDLKKRLRQAQDELVHLEETINRQERNMNLKLGQQKAELDTKHQEEIDFLVHEWESPVKVRRYNRTSQLLRQLRIQAIQMLNAKRYDEMRVVEKRANFIEENETTENQKRLERDFNEALTSLHNRHAEENAKLARAQKGKRDEYEKAKNTDIDVLQQRIRKLEREISEANDPDKLWSLRHRFEDNKLAVTVHSRGPNFRNTGKCPIFVSEFNTLNLPPLEEPRSARSPTPPPCVATQAQTGRPPKYSWL